jgi:hypothetical protein
MSKKIKKNRTPSFFTNFMAFWTTLPGILTGIAAVITAIAGLYLAFSPPKNSNDILRGPTPPVSPAQNSSSPAPESGPDNCLEQEVPGGVPVEVGSGTQALRELKDGAIRIKLTDNHQPVGGVGLRYYPDGDYFGIEKLVDAKCVGVADLYNSSRQRFIDIKKDKVPNNDYLRIQLGGQNYSLRLMSQGKTLSALFEKN